MLGRIGDWYTRLQREGSRSSRISSIRLRRRSICAVVGFVGCRIGTSGMGARWTEDSCRRKIGMDLDLGMVWEGMLILASFVVWTLTVDVELAGCQHGVFMYHGYFRFPCHFSDGHVWAVLFIDAAYGVVMMGLGCRFGGESGWVFPLGTDERRSSRLLMSGRVRVWGMRVGSSTYIW